MLGVVLRNPHHDDLVQYLLVQLRLHLGSLLVPWQQRLSRSQLSLGSSVSLQVDGRVVRHLYLHLQLLGHPVVEYEPLEHYDQDAGEGGEPGCLGKVGLLGADGAVEVRHDLLPEEPAQALAKLHLGSFLRLGIHWDLEVQLVGLAAGEADTLAGEALQLGLQLEVEYLPWVVTLHLLLETEHLLEHVLEVLLRVLLLGRLEFLVVLSHQRLEHVRLDPVLAVVYPLPVLLRLPLEEHLLGHLLLRVPPTHHPVHQLAHLALETGRSKLAAYHQVLLRIWQVLIYKLRQREEHLQHRVHVTRVAQILQTREPRAIQGNELLALLYHLGESQVQVGLQCLQECYHI